MSLFSRFFISVLLVLLLFQPAQAREENRLLEIPRGISHMDLTGDGKPETIISAYHETMDVHGYFVITFLDEYSHPDGRLPMSIIGIDGKDGRADSVQTFPGAECEMQDYRLLFKQNTTFLIQASQNIKNRFCETSTVTFDIFKLSYDGYVSAEYFFKPGKQWTTRIKYQSVKTAFDKEGSRLLNLSN